MDSDDISADVKTDLTRRFDMYDPVKLQGEVHRAVDASVSMNRATNLERGKALAASALQAI